MCTIRFDGYRDWKICVCCIDSIPLYKFFHISVNFENTKMVDHSKPHLKVSRPGVFDIRCLIWNTEIIVYMKKFRKDWRRYKSRHWILMFIGKNIRQKRTKNYRFKNPKNDKSKLLHINLEMLESGSCPSLIVCYILFYYDRSRNLAVSIY